MGHGGKEKFQHDHHNFDLKRKGFQFRIYLIIKQSIQTAIKKITMDKIIYDNSFNEFKILGSLATSTFDAKLKQIPREEMGDTVAVFTDVLRCTTTCLAIVAAMGAKGIVLKKKPKGNSFRFMPPCYPNQSWEYGGEKNGLPIKGLNAKNEEVNALISNSPKEVIGKKIEDSYLLFYSSNGAAAFDSIKNAGFSAVYAMSMANINATAKAIIESGAKKVWLVCSGFYGSACLEDGLANGALIDALLKMGFCSKSEVGDEAEYMRFAALRYMENSNFIPVEVKSKLKTGQVARLLANLLGPTGDLDACIDGTGIDDIWEEMAETTLVCRDFDTNLLINEINTNS